MSLKPKRQKSPKVRLHKGKFAPKKISKSQLRKVLETSGGGWTPYEGEYTVFHGGGYTEHHPAQKEKRLSYQGKDYKVELVDKFIALDKVLQRKTKPILKGTGVRIRLGNPSEDSPRKRYASGLDYADMANDEATIIELTANKTWDEIKKMKTKDGKSLYDAVWKAQSEAIASVFGGRTKLDGGKKHFMPSIEWETDWEGDNTHDWGLMKNPWHKNNM